MPDSPIITLTTDFGYKDPFAGVMKGVILNINPQAEIVDLTHGIRRHDIKEASFIAGMNYSYFPKSTIHVVVVDPGVGSARRPLIVCADDHYFIGPDNGVFSQVYAGNEGKLQVVHITSDQYFLNAESPTFQGRDVFAPVAGWLSKDPDIERFGKTITDYRAIPLPSPAMPGERSLKGEVILIDVFGNAITNIRSADAARICGHAKARSFRVYFHGSEVPFMKFYAQAEDQKLCALFNSSDYLEMFVNEGNASSQYSISVGDVVEVVPE